MRHGKDIWEELIAYANDIVEYQNGKWVIVFDASTNLTSTEYLTNSNTGVQYKWG